MASPQHRSSHQLALNAANSQAAVSEMFEIAPCSKTWTPAVFSINIKKLKKKNFTSSPPVSYNQ